MSERLPKTLVDPTCVLDIQVAVSQVSRTPIPQLTINLQFWSYIACCCATYPYIPVLATQPQVFRSATDLVLKNDIPDILHQSGDSQHVRFLFYVSLGCDAFVEGFRPGPDRTEIAGRELDSSSIGVSSRCLLEQLCAPLMLDLLPWVTTEPTQPRDDGFQHVPHR